MNAPLATATAPPTHSPIARLPNEAAVIEQVGRENFPVALRVLPSATRTHLMAIYGFARLVDDAGDEASGDRAELLDAIECDLDALGSGRVPAHPLVARLAPTMRECALPLEPFRNLVEANRRDQIVARYATHEELLGYCALSAAPIGRLVLHVFGVATAERFRLSDEICAALQLVEHWQDVAEDFGRGRIYLPAEDRARFGVTEEHLAEARAGSALRDLLGFEVSRTRARLARGQGLVGTLSGNARLAVAGFVGGGHAALDSIERVGFDVLSSTPQTRRRDVLRHACSTWWWGGAR